MRWTSWGWRGSHQRKHKCTATHDQAKSLFWIDHAEPADRRCRSMDQSQKAETFRQLHQQPHAFVIPNPWDVGTARLLAAMGFKALATTSMGYAFSVGQRDNTLSREQTLAYIATVAAATDLPVGAD